MGRPTTPRIPPRRLAWLVALFTLTLAVHIAARPAAPTAWGGRTSVVARVYYDHPRDIARLSSYDVWEYHNVAAGYVLAALTGPEYDALRADGWRVAIDEPATAQLASPAAENFFAGEYRTVDELYADLDAAAAAYPDLTEPLTYGQSHCLGLGGCVTLGGDALPGYPLRAIRVTNEAVAGSSTIAEGVVAGGEKPVFFLMANIHAREITTPELAMRFLDLLLDGYGTDADVTWLVDYHEIWIVPTANPDGHWLVELGERPEYGGAPFYQRKNARLFNFLDEVDDCLVWPPDTGAHYGVDLNRNHTFAWGGDGSSDDPCAATFRGPGPVSESETARLEALLRALVPDQRGPDMDDPAPDDTTGLFITLHSFGDLILWPWGHLNVDAPNKADLQAIGDKLATFNGYRSCQSAAWDCLYPAAGASDDWAYGELGIPAFTFEVGTRFMPPYNDIDSSQWPENGPALLYAAKIARTPYQTIHGPDVLRLLVAGPGPIRGVSATIDATNNGNRPIAAAAYTLDTPPWQGDATPVPLAAADDAFDSPVETVLAELDTSALAPGRHTLYLRGQDDAGRWGPVSAAFFTVPLAPPTEWLFLPAVAGQQAVDQ
jgi:hypothetical protein